MGNFRYFTVYCNLLSKDGTGDLVKSVGTPRDSVIFGLVAFQFYEADDRAGFGHEKRAR